MWPHYSLHSKLNALLRFHYCVRQDSLTDRVSRSSACISIRCPAPDAERPQFRLILKTSFAFGLRVVPLVRPRFARALRVERHHRLDLSRGAVRPLLFRRVASVRGAAQGAEEITGSRRPRRRVNRMWRARSPQEGAMSQHAASLPARPATALTLPGAASQIARIEIGLHPAAIQNAIE